MVLRTPDERFANLADYPFAPNYTTIRTDDGAELRIHHVDEGPPDGPLVLCMHGQPVWSYLYRKMIPLLVREGMRVIAPDLPGYGKSDKPAAREDYTYQNQVDWMGAWLAQNDLSGITFFGQDWGGLIGLRMIADQPDRFDRVVISNTGLPYNPDLPEEVVREVKSFRAEAPTPTLPEMARALQKMQDQPGAQAKAFAYWQKFCWETEDLPVGFMMSMTLERPPAWRVAVPFLLNRLGLAPLRPSSPLGRAYEAPFPDPSYKMGIRAMPSRVPTLPDDPSLEAQARAWSFYESFDKPFLCAFADDDPVTQGGDQAFIERVPGAKGQPHTTIPGGGHFVQENRPAEVVKVITDFVRRHAAVVLTVFAAMTAMSPGSAGADEVAPGIFRTPDSRFEDLQDYPWEPNYEQIGDYRVHYLDEGPRDADPVLLLHGEPTWSYLYRKMIPVLTAAGHRVIVPDLVGFGRSDKPADEDDYSYQLQIDTMLELVRRLDLRNATFFGQDWGGLIGLRVVAAAPERFARVAVSNTGLPAASGLSGWFGYPLFKLAVWWTGPITLEELREETTFPRWVAYSYYVDELPVGELMGFMGGDPTVRAAYEAPFPDRRYKAGAQIMPYLVPSELRNNERAWQQVYERWDKPFLVAFTDSDPITAGGEQTFLERVPTAQNVTIEGAGHFVQEDAGRELAALLDDFIAGREVQGFAVATAAPNAASPRDN